MRRLLKWGALARLAFAWLAGCAIGLGGDYEQDIRAFEARDQARPPASGTLLFTGSSSVRMWTNLTQAFPPHTVLNRGFGGSHMSDLLRYFDRVVIPCQPALVAVYEGENDLASGKSVDQVFADFSRFLDQMRQRLPSTDVLLLSVKLSPCRTNIWPQVRTLNERLKAAVDGRQVRFVDLNTPLLDAGGEPRRDLFQADLLHLNGAGYALWERRVRSVLDTWAAERGRPESTPPRNSR